MRKRELLEKIEALQGEVAALRGEVAALRAQQTPVWIPWYIQPNPEPYKITWGDGTGDHAPEPYGTYCATSSVDSDLLDGILGRWHDAWVTLAKL